MKFGTKTQPKKNLLLNNLNQIQKEIAALASAERAEVSRRFFKTGPGQYGEGDVFAGITVPQCRKIAQKYYREISLEELTKLLNSTIHEERLIALKILVTKYEKTKDLTEKTRLKDFYLDHLSAVNNWDLVDGSAPYILGDFLIHQDRSILFRLADSKNLWERRVAIISTFAFIRKSDFADTLKLSEKLLKDTHDLMHKAVGWMLREVGKKDEQVLRKFLEKNMRVLPRTALRYAIERLPENERLKILQSSK